MNPNKSNAFGYSPANTGADIGSINGLIDAHEAALIADHVAAVDPHTQYLLPADMTAHEGASDPHPTYLTTAEALALALNQFTAPTGDISLNSQKITNAATPVNPGDLTNKAYVDAVIQGVQWKGAARAGTTANITLSGTQTLDGIALVDGDVALVKNQTTQSQNGPYVVHAGAWTRTADADTSSEVPTGAAILVVSGTTQAGTQWVMNTPGPITLGTSALNWVQVQTGAAAGVASLTVDNATIENVGTASVPSIRVKDSGITNVKVSPTAAIALTKLATDPLARANHTGTQTAATVSDFNTAADARVTAGIATHAAAGDPHTAYALDTDLTTHAAAADPHSVYILESLGDAKGDLISFSADNTPAKVTITNGFIPKRDNTQTSGWTSVDPATFGGGGGGPALATTVSAETTFGISSSPGAAITASKGDHTHGSPTNPVPAHEALADPHPGYLLESLFDAKGDFISASGDNAPVKVSITNGFIPKRDNTQTSGWTSVDPATFGGGGGGTPLWSSAKYRIAAYNSSASIKAGASVVLDGTADEVEINAILQFLSAGDTVAFSWGLFVLSDTVKVAGQRGVRITGMGSMATQFVMVPDNKPIWRWDGSNDVLSHKSALIGVGLAYDSQQTFASHPLSTVMEFYSASGGYDGWFYMEFIDIYGERGTRGMGYKLTTGGGAALWNCVFIGVNFQQTSHIAWDFNNSNNGGSALGSPVNISINCVINGAGQGITQTGPAMDLEAFGLVAIGFDLEGWNRHPEVIYNGGGVLTFIQIHIENSTMVAVVCSQVIFLANNAPIKLDMPEISINNGENCDCALIGVENNHAYAYILGGAFFNEAATTMQLVRGNDAATLGGRIDRGHTAPGVGGGAWVNSNNTALLAKFVVAP